MRRRPARSRRHRGVLLALAVAQWLAQVAPSAAAEYRLAPGDVVEMALVGLADVRQRSQIDPDGNVTLPLIGAVPATGLSITQLRARVQELIARKVVRRQTDEGREYPVVIEPDEVTLTVAEYRPVYVNGDVSKPGEVPFRSDITVRQAVSLAGGYDVMRFRITNPFIQAADLESDLKSLVAERARQQARVARLEAELRNAPSIAPQEAGPAPALLAPAFLAQVRDLEAEQFRTRVAALASDRASLQTLIQFGEAELNSLNAQREREQEGAKADAADLARLSTIYDRGNLPINRVTDTRRVLLLSETRLLQTSVQIERIRRERQTDLRNLERLNDERRLEVSRELQETRVQLVATEAKVEATREKLLYTATVRSQLVKGTGGRPDIVVVRRQEDGRRQSFKGDEDTVLSPGDVVEVSLVAEFRPADPPSPAPAVQPPAPASPPAPAPAPPPRRPADPAPSDARRPR